MPTSRLDLNVTTVIGNAGEPVNSDDLATKNYVDSRPSGGGTDIDPYLNVVVTATRAAGSTSIPISSPTGYVFAQGANVDIGKAGVYIVAAGTTATNLIITTALTAAVTVDEPVFLHNDISSLLINVDSNSPLILEPTGDGSIQTLGLDPTKTAAFIQPAIDDDLRALSLVYTESNYLQLWGSNMGYGIASVEVPIGDTNLILPPIPIPGWELTGLSFPDQLDPLFDQFNLSGDLTSNPFFANGNGISYDPRGSDANTIVSTQYNQGTNQTTVVLSGFWPGSVVQRRVIYAIGNIGGDNVQAAYINLANFGGTWNYNSRVFTPSILPAQIDAEVDKVQLSYNPSTDTLSLLGTSGQTIGQAHLPVGDTFIKAQPITGAGWESTGLNMPNPLGPGLFSQFNLPGNLTGNPLFANGNRIAYGSQGQGDNTIVSTTFEQFLNRTTLVINNQWDSAAAQGQPVYIYGTIADQTAQAALIDFSNLGGTWDSNTRTYTPAGGGGSALAVAVDGNLLTGAAEINFADSASVNFSASGPVGGAYTITATSTAGSGRNDWDAYTGATVKTAVSSGTRIYVNVAQGGGLPNVGSELYVGGSSQMFTVTAVGADATGQYVDVNTAITTPLQVGWSLKSHVTDALWNVIDTGLMFVETRNNDADSVYIGVDRTKMTGLIDSEIGRLIGSGDQSVLWLSGLSVSAGEIVVDYSGSFNNFQFQISSITGQSFVQADADRLNNVQDTFTWVDAEGNALLVLNNNRSWALTGGGGIMNQVNITAASGNPQDLFTNRNLYGSNTGEAFPGGTYQIIYGNRSAAVNLNNRVFDVVGSLFTFQPAPQTAVDARVAEVALNFSPISAWVDGAANNPTLYAQSNSTYLTAVADDVAVLQGFNGFVHFSIPPAGIADQTPILVRFAGDEFTPAWLAAGLYSTDGLQVDGARFSRTDSIPRNTTFDVSVVVLTQLNTGGSSLSFSGNGITGDVTPTEVTLGTGLQGTFANGVLTITSTGGGGSVVNTPNIVVTFNSNTEVVSVIDTAFSQFAGADYLNIVFNGRVLRPTTDYTLSGTTVNFNNLYAFAGDVIQIQATNEGYQPPTANRFAEYRCTTVTQLSQNTAQRITWDTLDTDAIPNLVQVAGTSGSLFQNTGTTTRYFQVNFSATLTGLADNVEVDFWIQDDNSTSASGTTRRGHKGYRVQGAGDVIDTTSYTVKVAPQGYFGCWIYVGANGATWSNNASVNVLGNSVGYQTKLAINEVNL